MNRRDFLKGCAAAVGGVMLSNRGLDVRLEAGRPNVVFFLIDDMGWRDAGCYGSTFYETPNIDALASEGMLFTNAYASPVCSPTRASIMTGKYPARVHLTDFIAGKKSDPSQKLLRPEFEQALPLGEVTIAEALDARGYISGYVGKWHLGKKAPYLPEGQGFDYTGEHITSSGDDPKSVDVLTRRAIDFMEQNSRRPFFLYLSHHAVHLPIDGPAALIAKYEAKEPSGGQGNAGYAAMTEYMDDSVGRVLTRLGELGLSENTVVIFFSDNGGYSYEKSGEQVTNNSPLREGKGTMYEGGIRVPLIVRWPGHVAPGSVCDEQVMGLDLYPTVLDIAGVKDVESLPIDGLSLTGLLKGRDGLGRDAIFWHYPHYHHTTPVGAVRRGDWKLLEYFEYDQNDPARYELYNLIDDIGETNDLSGTQTAKRDELAEMLRNWRVSVDAHMPVPNPDYEG
jgi:arylsulfatase A-like enzyme